MASRKHHRFENVVVDLWNLRVTVDGEIRPLEPKSFRLLQFLIENRDRVVSKEEIFGAVWPGAFVSDNALTRAIAQIRKAIEDDPKQPRYIETVPTIGYRFLATLEPPLPEESETVAVKHEEKPERDLRPAVAWRSRPALWLILSAVVLAAVLVAIGGLARRGDTPATEVRATLVLPPETKIALGRGSAVAFSPDGRKVVYSLESQGKVQLYLHSLDSFDPVPLPGTEGATNPFFSPDGLWIGFFADRKLKKVSVDGGSPVAITDAVAPRGESWGPDDTIFLTPVNISPVFRVSALGGPAQQFTKLQEGELSHRWPQVLPGGQAILFTVWNDVGWEPARIAIQRLDEPNHRIILNGGGYGRYVEDSTGRGFLVYARAEGLMAAPFDLGRLELAGSPVPVLDGVITNLSGGVHFSVSSSGTLAYVPGGIGEQDRDLVWVERDGKEQPVIRARSVSRMFDLSPDGTQLVRNNTAGPIRDVWTDDLLRGTSTRITFQGDYWHAIWSADAKWLAYAKGLPTQNLYRTRMDGGKTEERLTTSPNNQDPSSWSPDGRTIAFTEFDPVSGADIGVLTLDGTAASVRPFLKTPFSEGRAQFSPDGRWLAYQSNESGRFEIYVRPFPEGDPKLTVSAEGGFSPMWSPRGGELFYLSPGNRMMAVTVTASADFRLENARALFDSGRYDGIYAVSPDARRFLMMPLMPAEAAPTRINIVVNWLPGLRNLTR